MTGKMKAAMLKEFGKPLVIEEKDIPSPGPDEVLVKVKASGHSQDRQGSLYSRPRNGWCGGGAG